jgi:hypothetical protein
MCDMRRQRASHSHERFPVPLHVGWAVRRAGAVHRPGRRVGPWLGPYPGSCAQAKEMLEGAGFAKGGQAVVLGGATIAGFFASVCSLPFDFVKTRIQKMEPGPDGKFPYKGPLDCAVKTLAQEGPLKFYTGFPTYCVRCAPRARGAPAARRACPGLPWRGGAASRGGRAASPVLGQQEFCRRRASADVPGLLARYMLQSSAADDEVAADWSLSIKRLGTAVLWSSVPSLQPDSVRAGPGRT